MKATVVTKEVVKALQSGKEWAFQIVYESYHDRVYGLALKMGLSREEAEGVLQEVFISIWDQRRTIKPKLSVNALILTIAKRKIIGVIRKNISITKRNQRMKLLIPSKNYSTEEYVIFEELLNEAKERLDSLPKKQKQIFMLSKQEGLSNDEIASKLNLSKRTVENQLFRATKELKSFLNLN